MKKYINKLYFSFSQYKKQCVHAFLQEFCINCGKFNVFYKKVGLKYVHTRYLNQDPLKNTFFIIRSQEARNKNCCCFQKIILNPNFKFEYQISLLVKLAKKMVKKSQQTWLIKQKIFQANKGSEYSARYFRNSRKSCGNQLCNTHIHQ